MWRSCELFLRREISLPKTMVYVYNFKEITGETAISEFGIVIPSKRGL